MSSFTQSIYKRVIWTVGAFLLSAHGIVSAESGDELAETLRKRKADISTTREDIERSRKRLRSLEARERPLADELERLSRELNALYRAEKATSARLQELKKKLKTARARRTALEADIQALEKDAAKRLVALYKLGVLGVAPLIFSCNSFSEFLQKQKALEEISHHDSALWVSLRDKKRAHEGLSRQISQEETLQRDLWVKQRRDRNVMKERKGDLDALMAAIRADKKRTRDYINKLKASAKELEQTIKALETERAKRRKHAPGPTGAFLAAKGVLPSPVDGDVIEPYGAYDIEGHYNIKGFRSGIHIQAEYGTPVKAVHPGEVIYAGPLRGYGNMVIIDHGDHYYTLSGQLAEFLKKPADMVSVGDVIGSAGGVNIHGRPGVYFEIRHHGTPLDPAPWLSTR